MKKYLLLLGATAMLVHPETLSQDVYPISSSEFLFQFANIENPNLPGINRNMRFTIVFNYGQYWHVDFNDHLGMYTGLAVRNVGFIYDTPDPSKTIRRSYTAGIPLALKIGAFDKHLYVMGGGEYELLFHYRARKWDSNNRNGTVTKESEWFSDKTKRLVPSVFAGMQFPGGFNLKFKYYLQGFLNEDYTGPDLGDTADFSDFTRLNVYYISLSWQFRTDRLKKFVDYDEVASIY